MKHTIEVLSAGCQTCKDTIEAVKKLAGSDHNVVVHDIHQQEKSQAVPRSMASTAYLR